MKSSLLTLAVSLASTALADASPYPGILLQSQANYIVNGFKSILENVTYNGMTPNQTAQAVVAPNYHEISDSILSLISKNNTLGGAAATSRDEWYAGVSRNPVPNIQTINIYVAGFNNILWYWNFPQVGIARYPVKGFNLFRIDSNLQIYEADIEFNSIAWGVDIFEIQQYCSP